MPDKLFCPEFVYEICVGQTVGDFVAKEMTLEMVAKKFSLGLSDHYHTVAMDELSLPAEEILRFMSDQKNPKFEANDKANFFVFYKLKFNGLKGKRKLKGLFGNAFDGIKEKQYNPEKTVMEFKAFVFALRAGNVPRAPAGWDINNEPDLMQLGEILKKERPIDDLL